MSAKPASKPLFVDPLHDGAADPVVVRDPQLDRWLMYYTSRRADVEGLNGVTWVHGTPIGMAQSTDGGASWRFLGTAGIRYGRGSGVDTYWAPEVLEHEGQGHMYLTFVPGIHEDWGHPRRIVHLTSRDMLTWRPESELELSSDRVIDACVIQLEDGTWRMWYNDERDGKSIYFADSPDLYDWTDRGRAAGERPGEGPTVFRWRGAYWMIVDEWSGLGVYRSEDALAWQRQTDRILEEPGTGADDNAIGQHADVVVADDRAWILYFTHPGRTADAGQDVRRSVIQVAELESDGRTITCNRNRDVTVSLR